VSPLLRIYFHVKYLKLVEKCNFKATTCLVSVVTSALGRVTTRLEAIPTVNLTFKAETCM